LEERLPPGDVLLGGMLSRSWLAPEITRLASEQALAASRAEFSAVRFEHASTDRFYAAAGQNTGFKLILSANPEQRPQAATGSTSDPGRPVNSSPKAVEPAFRDASGLTNDVLDQLLGDDLGQLSTSRKQDGSRSQTGGEGTGSESPAAGQTGAGGGLGGCNSTLEQPGGPSTPFMPDSQNGGMMGGGGAASTPGAAGAAVATPNLITSGHFAPGGGGPHGTITPYASNSVWPSYTPPTTGGSGGGPPIDTVNSSSGGSNSGSSGGINNSNNGSSGGMPSGGGQGGGMPSGGGQGGGGQGGGMPSGGGPSGGGSSGGGPSGGGQSGGCNCGCSGFMIENAPGVADHSISPASEYSPAGVRYFDGQINVTSTDLSTDGFGSFWNQVRSWSNGTPPSSNNGSGVIDMDRPYLLRPNGDNSQIVVASSISTVISSLGRLKDSVQQLVAAGRQLFQGNFRETIAPLFKAWPLPPPQFLKCVRCPPESFSARFTITGSFGFSTLTVGARWSWYIPSNVTTWEVGVGVGYGFGVSFGFGGTYTYYF
jgi:hypothetical protein